MSPEFIVLIGVVVFFVLLACETPVGISLAASGGLGLVLLRSFGVADRVFAGTPFDATARFSFIVVPMYILIGMFTLRAGVAEDVFTVAHRFVGRVRGGLGVATIMACAGFAAVTGSSIATAATIGRIAIGEMVSRGYDRRLAAGIVAAGGTLGVLIPPSVILVIYGIITGESIAQLLAAGVVPGVLSAAFYIAYIAAKGSPALLDVEGDPPSTALIQQRTSGDSPVAAEEFPGETHVPDPSVASRTVATRRLTELRKLPWGGPGIVGIVFAIVVGGVYTGLFTVTESGALGALVAFVAMVFRLGRKGLRPVARGLRVALSDSASVTSMAFMVVVGASVFSFFLIVAGLPARIAQALTGLDAPGIVVVVLILLVMIPLGMALDPFSILVITVPLTYPAVTALGFDGIWFGILMVKMIELSLITPPIGLNVFIVAGSSDVVSTEEVFRGVAPFAVIDILTVAFLVTFPAVVLWLPSLVQ